MSLSSSPPVDAASGGGGAFHSPAYSLSIDSQRLSSRSHPSTYDNHMEAPPSPLEQRLQVDELAQPAPQHEEDGASESSLSSSLQLSRSGSAEEQPLPPLSPSPFPSASSLRDGEAVEDGGAGRASTAFTPSNSSSSVHLHPLSLSISIDAIAPRFHTTATLPPTSDIADPFPPPSTKHKPTFFPSTRPLPSTSPTPSHFEFSTSGDSTRSSAPLPRPPSSCAPSSLSPFVIDSSLSSARPAYAHVVRSGVKKQPVPPSSPPPPSTPRRWRWLLIAGCALLVAAVLALVLSLALTLRGGHSSSSAAPPSLLPVYPAGLLAQMQSAGVQPPSMWLSAPYAALTLGISSGGSLPRWPALSAAAPSAVAASADSAPMLMPAALQGKAAVQFNASQSMTVGGGMPSGGNGFSIILLLSMQPPLGAAQQSMQLLTSASSAWSFELRQSSSGALQATSGGAGGVWATSAELAPAWSAAFLLTLVYSPLTSQLQLFQNGSEVAVAAAHGDVQAEDLVLGGSADAASAAFQGQMSELLMFNYTLDSSNRTWVEQQLAGVYGLPFRVDPSTLEPPTALSSSSSSSSTSPPAPSSQLPTSGTISAPTSSTPSSFSSSSSSSASPSTARPGMSPSQPASSPSSSALPSLLSLSSSSPPSSSLSTPFSPSSSPLSSSPSSSTPASSSPSPSPSSPSPSSIGSAFSTSFASSISSPLATGSAPLSGHPTAGDFALTSSLFSSPSSSLFSSPISSSPLSSSILSSSPSSSVLSSSALSSSVSSSPVSSSIPSSSVFSSSLLSSSPLSSSPASSSLVSSSLFSSSPPSSSLSSSPRSSSVYSSSLFSSSPPSSSLSSSPVSSSPASSSLSSSTFSSSVFSSSAVSSSPLSSSAVSSSPFSSSLSSSVASSSLVSSSPAPSTAAPPINNAFGQLNTSVDYCLNYGTNDSTLCLLELLSTPGYLQVPVPNFTYYVALHVTFYVQPLVVGPGTYFDGQNCTFVNIAPTPYIYSDQVGWIEDPLGYKGRNYQWFSFMMNVASNTVVYNVTLVSPIPSQALNVMNNNSNIRLAYMTITNIPGLFVNTTDSLQFSIKRNGINIADYAHDIEIDHCYLYNVGYGIIIDASYVYNVDIHDNVIANVSADGVCINTPAFGYEIGQITVGSLNETTPYYYVPYQATNISVHDNSISWTGWSHYGTVYSNSDDESFGFGISVAGGWNVSIERNYLYSTTWQAVHVEAHSHYLTISSNVIDTVGGTGWWGGYINGVWYSQSYWVEIANNTFRNIPDSAVRIEPTATNWCVANTGGTNVPPCVPYPGQEWHLRWVWITSNTFESWGTALGCHEFAVYVGGAAVQEVQTFLSNNTYNPVYANLNGSCNQNGYVFCNCAYNVSVNELSPPLTGCTGNVFTDDYCRLAPQQPTTTTSSSLIAWWSSLSVQSPQQYVPPTPFNAAQWDLTQFGVQTWVDSTGSSYTATTPPSAAALPPTFTHSAPGQPGLLFTANSLLQAPSLWPTLSDYTLSVVLWPSSASASGVIVGSSTHSLSLLNGSYYLVHGGVAASSPALAQADVTVPIVLTVSYAQSSRVVSYYVDGQASGSGMLSVDNGDAVLQLGGGWSGLLFDVQLFAGALDAADVYSYAFTSFNQLYCRLFVDINNDVCPQT